MAALRQPDLNTTRQSAFNKLVEYAKKIFEEKDRDGCSIVVKPCGAFKEHHNFFAKMEKTLSWDGSTPLYHLIVYVDDILRENGTEFHSVFGVTLGSCQDVEAALKHFIWVLEDITFDKKTGQMWPKKDVKSDFDMNQVLSDLWEMEEDLDCCVCRERTNTETKCGHKLCIPCWATINTKFHDEQGSDDEDEVPKCPMCRADIDCMK
jgi:hypothetical protein